MLILTVHRCMNYIGTVQSVGEVLRTPPTLNSPNVVHTPMDSQNKHFNP